MPWCFFQGTPFPSQLPHLCWVPWLIFLPFVLLWLQTQKDGLCRLARTLVWLFHICVSVGSPAVPCRRQRALTRLPGFCAKSHMYFIHSLVIAASPFCLLCLTQNKIIMTYTWFDTLKKLEQEDNVCKSFKPFWRKSLPELYLIPSLGVLPCMKSNSSENHPYRFYNNPLMKERFFFSSYVPSVPISINIPECILYWHFPLLWDHSCWFIPKLKKPWKITEIIPCLMTQSQDDN